MHYLSSVYFVNEPLHVLGIFVAHHQEVYCIYTTAGTRCEKHNTYQFFVYIYIYIVYIYTIYIVYLLMMGYKYARSM